MASKFKCRCGALIRKNLYEGSGLRLLVAEELTDVASESTSVDALLDRIVAQSPIVAICSQCGLLAIVDDVDLKVVFYAPVP
ncbi:hypothetical protein [Variovorax paradoxus]|uniref:hypothetical protein n=1 Tax=Variovorax paradoxus TaxID=34073 RepID=UPI00193288F5|nr:hypothetical protein INQ48_12085 [Variovorax paradoxus]